MSAYPRPLPRVTPDNLPFWEAARRHELRLQRCGACGRFWHPPGPVCPDCLSERFDWTPVSGRGTVSSFVVFHKTYFPAFADAIPYAVVQVELEEGPRLTANLVNVPLAEIRIGMPVSVVFDDVTPEISIPRFRRAP
ncbi:MAG: hypothetical protein A2X50_03540 [Candidatus Rokubacteria bacterium GWF2_70_14]|nr:MAG: hypothetical protein A2X50_03540 [Candidatus Rokubacteria bacterium GWF2_70_14]